jgi:hypothetical protein
MSLQGGQSATTNGQFMAFPKSVDFSAEQAALEAKVEPKRSPWTLSASWKYVDRAVRSINSRSLTAV